MLTVATIAVPQALVAAPTWMVFIATGFMFAVLISIGYRLSNVMDEEMACLLAFIPGIAAVLIIAPGVFEKKGFEGTEVLNMSLGVLVASLVLSLPLFALLEMTAPHIRQLLHKVDATSDKSYPQKESS